MRIGAYGGGQSGQENVAVGEAEFGERSGRSDGRAGSCCTGRHTHRGSVVKGQPKNVDSCTCTATLTIQATGIAQPGMLSLQKPKTSVRAVISKGIKSAS